MPRKIAVLGSNSFSGSDFIDLLLEDKNNEVIGISRSPEKDAVFLPYKRHKKSAYRFYQLDFNKDIAKMSKLFDQFQPEYIVNFAALNEVAMSWIYPWDYFETNIVSLSRLGQTLKNKKYLKKYLHISSPEVYGSCNGDKEKQEFNPSTPYAASKAAADLFLSTMVNQYGFPVVTIRSTNVYGPGQQLYRIIPKSIILIKKGIKIPLDGGGLAKKSYIHIRDISKGELLAMEKGKTGEIYHFSPENPIAVRDVVQLICDLMDADYEKMIQVAAERPGQDKIYAIDSSKARKELDWTPAIGLKKGIKEVIDWVNQNWAALKDESLEYVHKL